MALLDGSSGRREGELTSDLTARAVRAGKASPDAGQAQRPLALMVVGTALILGALGDGLLRALPWGLNAPLWLAVLCGTVLVLLRRQTRHLAADGYVLLIATLGFAGCLALRDSPTMRSLNGLAMVVSLALALASLRAWPGQLRIAAVTDYALTVSYTCVHALAGAIPLLRREIGWRSVPSGRWYGPALAATRGALLALPLLLLFGGLFVAADAGFERLVSRAVHWDGRTLLSHLTLTLVYAWIVAGLLRGVLQHGEGNAQLARQPARPWLGKIEMAIVLGLLDVLFLTFVLVQVPYLFGGVATIAASEGLTYAHYARRGFFELVAVAGLALPVLLQTHASLRREGQSGERLYRLLAGTLVALLFAVMASALQRMFLYQRLYGLTELRVYTTAFMGWLGLVFIWFVATVLRGRRRRFAIGALVSALAVVALLDVLSPDSLIVRTNVARVTQGEARAFDDLYAASLSADAVPDLVAALPSLPPDQQGALAWRLLRTWSPPATHDWRTWNWGRTRSWAAVHASEGSLQAVAKQPPARPD
jgi:hypothetical protein